MRKYNVSNVALFLQENLSMIDIMGSILVMLGLIINVLGVNY